MTAEPEEPPIRFTDNRKIDRDGGTNETTGTGGGDTPSGPVAGEASPPPITEDNVPKADALLLEERTRDLQRVSAEYANYRKRAERERLAAGDVAVGRTLAELLPVVDDLDRAKAHGDLTGALKAVADKLDGVFTKLGLEAFGEVGDPFDPAIHEAVMHDESDAVTTATCTTVLRPGFRHRDRLLRPAMVGVTDPLHPAPAEAAPVDEQPVDGENSDQQSDAHAPDA